MGVIVELSLLWMMFGALVQRTPSSTVLTAQEITAGNMMLLEFYALEVILKGIVH
jgi:hypothetical protein